MLKRFLAPCCALFVAVAAAQSHAQNITLSIVSFQGTNVTGDQTIDAEVFVTVGAAPQGFKGVNLDVPCTSGYLTVSSMVNATESATSLGGVPKLFPGGLGGENVVSCTMFHSLAIGGAPEIVAPAGVRWLGTYKLNVADCATGSAHFEFENHSAPPLAADQTKVRDDAAGQGNLVAFNEIGLDTNVIVGTCCDSATNICIVDGVNEYCCENGLTIPPVIAGQFNANVTCASPNACACQNNDQCGDGNICNGIETCVAGSCQPGVPLVCNDGNVCTDDSCVPASGCLFDAAGANGDPCGSGANTDCDNPDTCLNGACASNNEANGTACGNPADTDCDNPDTCVGGACQSNNAANGAACTDDGNQCTDDLCQGGNCNHPNDNTNACSDGLNCTSGDHCLAGGCSGTPANCDDGLVCTADSCDEGSGGCVNEPIPDCVENPDISLDPIKDENGANCHDAGEQVCVEVNFGGTPVTLQIAGGQFAISYNPACLDFESLSAGDVPWTNIIFQSVNEVTGKIFVAVGSPVGGPGPKGSNLPGTMVTICFTKIGVCNECNLCTTDINPQHTRLVTIKGQEVIPADTTVCSKDIFDAGDITVDCPGDQDVNADCMSSTAVVEWDAPSFVDECDGALDHECTCTVLAGEMLGDDCDYLAENGGVFPQGRFSFTCSATDDNCNETATCSWTVQVSDEQTLDVKLQLSPIVENDEMDRCICFELFSSCTPLIMEEVCETITFGGPFEFNGQATASVKVPKGKYVCIQARDRQHSLRSTSLADFTCDGSVYHVTFKGDPFFGGNWLIQGNLNRDRVIDILDFGTFLGQMNQNPNPPKDKSCDDNGGDGFTHADFNSDGVVDIADYTFIFNNFLKHDKADCCHPATASDPVALESVTVKQLREMGMADLTVADLNNDGFVNVDDMVLFAEGARPKAAGKGTRGNTSRIGSAK